MPSKKDIYRQSALDRLSSPEHLEDLMQVIGLKGWIALSGLCVVLVGAVAWGFFGSIPNNVLGEGLLIKDGGIERVSTFGAGQITEVNVEAGSFVKENEIVAEIFQPDLIDRIRSAEANVKELQAQKDLWPVLQRELKRQQGKMVTNPQELLSLRQRINEAQYNLKLLQEKLELSSKVRSKFSGRVLEVMLEIGHVVNVGTTVLILETGSDIMAVLYFPDKARNIQLGTTVQIAPATVKKEEYGTLIGTVTSVSGFPATEQGMMRILENQMLVRQLTSKGPPIEVRVELLSDAQTVSGYKWTSARGREVEVFSGTACSSTLSISHRSPIGIVIPTLREWIGI